MNCNTTHYRANSSSVPGDPTLPTGSPVRGIVTAARRPGKLKGRGYVAMRFQSVTPRGTDETYRMATHPIGQLAPATKKADAVKIGVPAAGGAIVGGIVDGKKGAAIGSAVGGGAGTAMVLSTRGKDARLGRGAVVTARLASPLTVKVKA